MGRSGGACGYLRKEKNSRNRDGDECDRRGGVRLAKKILAPERPKAILADYLKELGRRVRDLRQKAGWTQEQLAKITRLTRAYIVAVEGGKQNVFMDVVIRVANGLGVAPDQLLAMEEAPVTALNKIPD